MTQSPTQPQTSHATLRAAIAPTVIVALGLVVYWNSLSGVFILDDDSAILANPTLRHVWPLAGPLSPPRDGSPVDGRPVVNLTLAVNYSLGGLNPWGYHAVNILIHILAALALFGVVRQTLLIAANSQFDVTRSCPTAPAAGGLSATALALAAATLWLVHPLQTESVTYISQRAESLAALFYLLTLYCAIRGFAATSGTYWYVASILACLVGMATKEVMVSAPLMVLLYDRLFVSGSFRKALGKRTGLYAGLMATWAMLAMLVLSTGTRAGTAGFGAGITPWSYACTQFGAILHYLRLAIWPSPLVLDYGTAVTRDAWQIIPAALGVAVLLAATIAAFAKRRFGLAFLGTWFFVILAPSSSLVPVVTQTMAEHRMYLPLAAVIVLAVLAVDWAWRKIAARLSAGNESASGEPAVNESAASKSSPLLWIVPLALWLVVAGVLAGATIARNADYHSELRLWQDTAAKMKDNPRAFDNLGSMMMKRGDISGAMKSYEKALQLKPDAPQTNSNYGHALTSAGRYAEAVAHLETAVQLEPNYAEAHSNIGHTLSLMEKFPEAIRHLDIAIKLKPDYAEAYNNKGNALTGMGRLSEAMAQYAEAIRIRPDFLDAHCNLALAQLLAGDIPAAEAQCKKALAIDPNCLDALNRLGTALMYQNNLPEAAQCFEKALKINPSYVNAGHNLALVWMRQGKLADATALLESVLRIAPDFADAHCSLGNVLLQQKRTPEGVAHLEQALRINPAHALAHINMAMAMAASGQLDQAIAYLERASQANPNSAEIRTELARLRRLRP